MAKPRHSARATAALQALAECDPALAALALWCRHRDSDSVDLVQTVGTEISYGPGFGALAQHVQIGLAGHHILHVALQHSARMAAMQARQGADFAVDLWQIACDGLVNDAILAAGHALPRPALTASQLLGEASGAVLAAWDAERLYHKLQARDGAGQDLVRAQANAQGFRPDLGPEAGEQPSGTGPDAGDWRGHLARALAAGRAAGVGLGALGLRLADLPRPFVPWEQVLRRWLAQRLLPRPGISPMRPARRWLALAGQAVAAGEPVAPWQPATTALRPQPRRAIALDSSGSVSMPLLRRFLAEAGGVVRRLNTGATLLVFDTEIRSITGLEPADWRKTVAQLALPEGGGTDFRPIFAHLAQKPPDALIVLSDLDGPMPQQAPRYPVLWACAAARPVPFGRVLSLER
ncbi:MAG: VWA-like domain-containing protein [Roseinatronobacter sp.]|nr:VWA-like domain-containing protein [Roseinatronobacter sp.]